MFNGDIETNKDMIALYISLVILKLSGQNFLSYFHILETFNGLIIFLFQLSILSDQYCFNVTV